MGAEIVTYSGKTVTSLDDALVYESALGAGGVIYGAFLYRRKLAYPYSSHQAYVAFET